MNEGVTPEFCEWVASDHILPGFTKESNGGSREASKEDDMNASAVAMVVSRSRSQVPKEYVKNMADNIPLCLWNN